MPFWQELQTTDILKIAGGWIIFWVLQENMSWACFDLSGLKDIFLW